MSFDSHDHPSLCSFTFSDGRRCRTPRSGIHSQFCHFHARRDAQLRAGENLGRDVSYFFSGDYLSACDLNAALGRLFAAVAQGHVTPRTARTLAYLGQTMVQTIHLSREEYIRAFGDDAWFESIETSVNGNFKYRLPPSPEPQPSQPQPSSPQLTSASPAAASPSPDAGTPDHEPDPDDD